MSTTEVREALHPWRRRLRLQRVATWTLWGLAAGLAVAATLLLASRFVPWSGAQAWAVAAALACALGGLAYALATPPAFARAARRVDRRLGLADRAATAWDLRDATSPFAALQRRDTVAALLKHSPSSVPVRPTPRPVQASAAGLLAIAALVLLPDPMDRVQAERAAFEEQIAGAKEEVQQAREEVQQPGSPLSAEEREKIDEALKALEERLAEASDKPEALAALSEAEQSLQELREPGQAEALQQVASALASASAAAALAEALQSGDGQALAEAMEALAGQLAALSPEEQQALAAALQRAANTAGGVQGLPEALRDLARSLASGNPQASGAALGDLESLLAALQQGVATELTVNDLLAALADARGRINGVSGSQPGGANAGGQGNEPGEGSGSGSGSGGGDGPGNGSGSGQGAGSGPPGVGSGGGQGGLGAGNAPGSRQGGETGRLGAEGETVFVPSQGEGDLPSVPVGSGPGAGAGGLRPYREVIGEYAEQARSHIERSPVPEGYKDMVRRYFAEMGE